MVYEIIWTPNAQSDFQEIVQYLEENWSSSLAEKFSKDCLATIQLLEALPFIGQVSQKDSRVRKLLITRHISLYYSIQSNIIFLLDFFDNRQNPTENPFE